jgi:hypothetical protein
MISLALLSAALMGFTELPPQAAAPGRCRTFLWTRSETPMRIAMIDETARTMRLARGKQLLDIAEVEPGVYGGSGFRIAATLAFVEGGQIQNGQVIDSGALRIEQQDANGAPAGDALVVPVGGMRGCG